eukprot:1855893-Rhodomonas_salina.1
MGYATGGSEGDGSNYGCPHSQVQITLYRSTGHCVARAVAATVLRGGRRGARASQGTAIPLRPLSPYGPDRVRSTVCGTAIA